MSQADMQRLLDRCIPEPNSGCWLWTSWVDDCGYGRISRGNKSLKAHRESYKAFVGPIPEGLTLDHLCRVRCCINPDHLEPVTRRENTLRGFGFSGMHARQTHCKKGHPFSPENVYLWAGRYRVCKPCRRVNTRKYLAKVRGTGVVDLAERRRNRQVH